MDESALEVVWLRYAGHVSQLGSHWIRDPCVSAGNLLVR